MRREESTANPEKQPGHDDANANPGTGASGPGQGGWEGGQVNVVGGEAEIDLDQKRAAMEESGGAADPAAPYLEDRVTPDPEVQSGG